MLCVPIFLQLRRMFKDLSVDGLEAHYLAIGTRETSVGLRLQNVVVALISANRAQLELSPARAMSIDLAGRNIVDAINTSVLPRIIETPKIAAVAKDGIQVIAMARITVRTNLDRLVGGAWRKRRFWLEWVKGL